MYPYSTATALYCTLLLRVPLLYCYCTLPLLYSTATLPLRVPLRDFTLPRLHLAHDRRGELLHVLNRLARLRAHTDRVGEVTAWVHAAAGRRQVGCSRLQVGCSRLRPVLPGPGAPALG